MGANSTTDRPWSNEPAGSPAISVRGVTKRRIGEGG